MQNEAADDFRFQIQPGQLTVLSDILIEDFYISLQPLGAEKGTLSKTLDELVHAHETVHIVTTHHIDDVRRRELSLCRGGLPRLKSAGASRNFAGACSDVK